MPTIQPDARILIVRLSAIGDLLHGVPVLCALRDALPRAFIAWVAEGQSAELVRGHRAINQIIQLPRGWYKSPRGMLALGRQLRALRFDVTIDLQGLTKSAAPAWVSGARRRIGFGDVDGRELSRWLNNELVEPTQTHVIDRNLELLGPLGIHRPTVRFDLPENVDATRSAACVMAASNLGEQFAIINPGAGWPSKLWPADRFAAAARHLGQAHALRSLVVWAGQAEHSAAEQIVAGSGGFAVLAPKTSLIELAALARRATLFVASDTGPLHLAVAVGTPCVGLFGPMPAERNGPYGAQHVAVQKMLLGGSRRDRRTAGPESMEAISVADVTAACDEILSRGESVRRSA